MPNSTPFVIADEGECNTMEFQSQSEAMQSLLTHLAFKHDDYDTIKDAFEESTLFKGVTKWSDPNNGKWLRLEESEMKKAFKNAGKSMDAEPTSDDVAAVPVSTPVSVATPLVVAPVMHEQEEGFDVDPVSGEKIPCFDTRTMKGIYKKVVDLMTAGTTMPPQFTYGIIKTVVGALLAGKVKFASLDDAQPTFYFIAIGRTGSSKGWSWRRLKDNLLNARGLQEPILRKLKFVNSADSAAGIRDFFFDEPLDASMLIFIDEIKSLGNKANSKKQPEILDLIGELSNSRSLSRVKARRNQKESGAKSRDDADLACIICAPSADSIATAFAGRMDEGFNDRLFPEYAIPQKAGAQPKIDVGARDALHGELSELVKHYRGLTIGITDEATAALEAFWTTQTDAVQRKVRFKTELELDAYMNAIGRHVDAVELEDMQDAITNFVRRLVIREVNLTKEHKTDVGRYLSIFKRLAAKVQAKLDAGCDPWFCGLSERDFINDSNAYRNDEDDIALRALQSFKSHLEPITRTFNGRQRVRYIPSQRD